MSERSGVLLAPQSLDALAARFGGELRSAAGVVERMSPANVGRTSDLVPLLSLRYLKVAEEAHARGAALLIDEKVATSTSLSGWIHPRATWAMAQVLDAFAVNAANDASQIHPTAQIGAHAVIYPRVVIGARAVIGAGAVIGAPGFGWAEGENGSVVHVPQLGGVVIGEDAHIGPLCTIASGTLSPTIVGRGAKLDAQVHVGHNVVIGEHVLVAAQSGFAGSVTIGRGARIGGQVGVADHVTIGAFAQIAAKSGVIGDVPEGATYAGYPAVPRWRWLRGLAKMYRGVRS